MTAALLTKCFDKLFEDYSQVGKFSSSWTETEKFRLPKSKYLKSEANIQEHSNILGNEIAAISSGLPQFRKNIEWVQLWGKKMMAKKLWNSAPVWISWVLRSTTNLRETFKKYIISPISNYARKVRAWKVESCKWSYTVSSPSTQVLTCLRSCEVAQRQHRKCEIRNSCFEVSDEL